ncbi:acid protease [Polyplosphaeria fusca]|uniref:Acid protease n=1 Tax=Polyplosphaeria fusca TaxID=682080 RepID=A0A9P4R816_9PLEO|nr:acid protease [Polyplosphaeria fusca]
MRITPSAYFAACLSISILPANAFYPYEPKYGDDANSKRAIPSQHRRDGHAIRFDPLPPAIDQRQSITLPIRKVPLRRENKYNIVNNNEPKQENSVAVDQDGTDLSYMVAVTFGESKEEYHLLLDSAASNTWVMSESCTTDACKFHNLFGEGDSSTLKTEDTTWTVNYGSGSVSGTLGSDTLHISSLSVALTFGLGTNVSSEFASYPMDGIMGVGRGDNDPNSIESPSIMDALSTSSTLKAKMFCIHLSRTADGFNDGEINFGDVNKERYDGDLNYIKIADNDRGFWEIGIEDAGVDGTKIGFTGRSAILDSGTSFILMPNDDAVAVHKLIPGFSQSGETFTVPCSTTKPVQIIFNGQTYNVSTADYVGGDLGNGDCKSNIIGRQTFDEKQWLVGDVFLKNVYTVFDFDNSQVGFGVKDAKQAASPSSSAPATKASSVAASTGGGATASATATTSGAGDASAEAASASSSPTGAAARASSSFALSVAFGLLSVFIQ